MLRLSKKQSSRWEKGRDESELMRVSYGKEIINSISTKNINNRRHLWSVSS